MGDEKKLSLEERIILLEREVMKMTEKMEKDQHAKVKTDSKLRNTKKEPWHTSLYDIEYCPKTLKKRKIFKPVVDREHDGDPIAYAYKNDLKSDHELEKVQDKCAYENGDCYYYKLLEKKPSITKVVDTPVKQNAVKEVHLDDGRTVYQIDYCKRLERSGIGLAPLIEKALEFKEIEIPEKWKPLPLTEYKSSFRDHRGIAPWVLTAKPAIPSKGELTLTVEREKNLTGPWVGQTEYREVISGLGSRIISDEYHGKIPLLPHEFVMPQDNYDVYRPYSKT